MVVAYLGDVVPSLKYPEPGGQGRRLIIEWTADL